MPEVHQINALISPERQEYQPRVSGVNPSEPANTAQNKPTDNKDRQNNTDKNSTGFENPKNGELSDSEKRAVENLKSRDREVKAHESAHQRAGSGLVKGGPSFDYTIGPDGKRYATGGEVKIDIAPVNGDPEATIKKMQQVRRAALAPADPSSQDRAVAAKATAIEEKARAELLEEKTRINNNPIFKSYFKEPELEVKGNFLDIVYGAPATLKEIQKPAGFASKQANEGRI